MQFFTLGSLKIEVFETYFSDTVFFPRFFSRKSVFGCRLHGVCMRRSGTSAYAFYALFSHFCYVGGFGDLSDPVVPTLRGVSGDVVTVYAYEDTKGGFLQSLALPTGGGGLGRENIAGKISFLRKVAKFSLLRNF